MTNNKHLRASITDYMRAIKLTYFETRGGNVSYATNFIMHTESGVGIENVAFEPFMELAPAAAQELMDDLWQCGVRPSEGSGSAGALAATERHLKDMQRLVFEVGVKAQP